MMADLKEQGSVASVVAMAVTEIVKLREGVVERRISFQKERSLSQCWGIVEEQGTLEEVEERLGTLVDQTLGGERSKGILRQLGTNMLKLKIHMDKKIMSLMMQPEKSIGGLCELVEQYSEDLAGKSVCSDEQANEVGFEGSTAAEDACFTRIAYSYHLNQLLEQTERESEMVLGGLTNNMGGFNQKDQIIKQLEQLEAVHQRLEQLQKIQALLSLQVNLITHVFI